MRMTREASHRIETTPLRFRAAGLGLGRCARQAPDLSLVAVGCPPGSAAERRLLISLLAQSELINGPGRYHFVLPLDAAAFIKKYVDWDFLPVEPGRVAESARPDSPNHRRASNGGPDGDTE